MFLEIFVFNNATDAQRLKDYEGEQATIYECDEGAEVIGRAGLGYSGYSNEPIWIVNVNRKL